MWIYVICLHSVKELNISCTVVQIAYESRFEEEIDNVVFDPGVKFVDSVCKNFV